MGMQISQPRLWQFSEMAVNSAERRDRFQYFRIVISGILLSAAMVSQSVKGERFPPISSSADW